MSRHTGRRAALALGASFIALAAATEASAQASGAGEQYTVDTIVVTAQRREERPIRSAWAYRRSEARRSTSST